MDETSPDNPNVCVSCGQWPRSERDTVGDALEVELVPVEEEDSRFS